MNGFHANGLNDYLAAIAKRHRLILADLRLQRRSLSRADDAASIDAKIKSEIASYSEQRRRASYCLF